MITPISNNNPNFRAFRTTIKNSSGQVINRGDTYLFRIDFDFKNFIKYICNKYKNVSKVNFIAHACSDGEEIYSVISYLINTVGENNAQKFFPIAARDIESSHIEQAKNGLYKVFSYDRAGIDFYLGDNFYDYFTKISDTEVSAKNIMKNHVKFSQSNILDDVNLINFDNTILLARNCWHYLGEDKIDILARKLGNKMNESSTLVIGDYDKQYNVDKILNQYGLTESKFVENLFEKNK